MTESLWDDTRLQAVRLVAEILATQENLDTQALCDAMDLDPEDLDELFDRIQAEWDRAKMENCPPRRDSAGGA